MILLSTIIDLVAGVFDFGSDILGFIFSFFGYAKNIFFENPLLAILLLLVVCKLFVVIKDVFL